MQPWLNRARFSLREYAARDQPITARRAPKSVERCPNDIIIIGQRGLEARLVARFLKRPKVSAAMSVDRRIVVTNHRHEMIGVAEHVLDRGGGKRVRRLPIVPLKRVELPLYNGA